MTKSKTIIWVTLFVVGGDEVFRIKKVFNNNVLLVTDENENEEIVMGKGLGFQKRVGETLSKESAKVDKTFVLEDKTSVKAFQDLLERINISEIELASNIIREGEKELGYRCNDNILLTLSDHIGFMLKRIRQGEVFATPLEWDIQTIYPKEYDYAKKAVSELKKETGLDIPKQEAAFIALHFINANPECSGMEETILSTRIVQNVLNITSYYYKKKFDESSYNFSRFVVHIRYFILRYLHGEVEDEETSILNVVAIKYQNDYRCALKIKQFLEDTYDWKVSDNELLYLTLHLNRLATAK